MELILLAVLTIVALALIVGLTLTWMLLGIYEHYGIHTAMTTGIGIIIGATTTLTLIL